eukprot:g7015.t1
MASTQKDSRAFLISLLREANVIDEIIDDVVQACEIANYSPFSFASNSVTVPMLAKKLYLTREEAESLKQVTLKHLTGVELNKNSDSSSMEPGPSHTTTNTNKISVEVRPFYGTGFEQTKKSWFSFGSQEMSAREENLESRTQRTDYTADRQSSAHSFVNEFSTVNEILDDDEQKSDEFENSVLDEKNGMAALADVYLDRAQRPRGRPFIPKLQLQTAGLTFGLSNAVQFPSGSDDLNSFPSVKDLSPLSTKKSCKKDIKATKQIKEELTMKRDQKFHVEELNNCETQKEMKIDDELPSYQRPTIASEARRTATLKRIEYLKDYGRKEATMSQSMSFPLSLNSPKTTSASLSRFGKPTKATLVRMEYIRHHLWSSSSYFENEFPKKNTNCLKASVSHGRSKRISKSTTAIAV